ncbi:hypothetical protein KRR55_16495 [Paeniglutamicibacter sp. ABSL32-1]|uniref:hypothetical protein n=1 Tax=Paeniglutamicibacter quisquiliarum TaxID=2849498 RepID=UPI001C2DA17B|nr:hypothetical protein [Paeniglutamicibacter quisquiliarum]MBV1780716.1 hypothetical protein [Paeniglutamicibacter quisquiliarum]
MHVAISTFRRVNWSGVEVIDESALVRRAYGEDGKVKLETLATYRSCRGTRS